MKKNTENNLFGAGHEAEEELFEREIGRKIREERIKRGMTQLKLAQQMGISSQQMHKYERGINHIAAFRLFRLSKLIGVEVSTLLPSGDTTEQPHLGRLDLELARDFSRVRGEQQRLAICQLVRSLVSADSSDPGSTPPLSRPDVLRLRLYVSSATVSTSHRSMKTIASLRRVCEARLANRYALDVVDVNGDPQAASQDRIVTIPTLLRLEPASTHVLAGDINDSTIAAWLKLA